jgi:hypothetical protein
MAYKQDCKSYPMAQAKMVFNFRVMHQTNRYQPPCPERIRHSQVRKSEIKESETRMSARLRQEQAASKLDVFQFLPAAIVINRRLLFCMTTSTWALSKKLQRKLPLRYKSSACCCQPAWQMGGRIWRCVCNIDLKQLKEKHNQPSSHECNRATQEQSALLEMLAQLMSLVPRISASVDVTGIP